MRYELSVHGIDVVLVEPGPFETKFLENVVAGTDEAMAEAYGHVNEFFSGFVTNVNAAFKDENAPTDPMLVVEAFEKLIDTPAGERPPADDCRNRLWIWKHQRRGRARSKTAHRGGGVCRLGWSAEGMTLERTGRDFRGR